MASEVKRVHASKTFNNIFMNFDIKIQKMLASNSKYNNCTENQVAKSIYFVNQTHIFQTKNINKTLLNICDNTNTWQKILPISCKFTPLYFTPSYPWTYRMSAKINNYYFGKKPIHNLLTFNINLSTNYQLRGSYFFSNYDTTNYGKLDNKRIKLYRVYPSLPTANLTPFTKFIYKPAVTNLNLAYLPVNKYDAIYNSFNKYSGNPWFGDSIVQAFSRKQHNIEPHNIMSKEIDSVVSMFDKKLLFIFNSLSAMYNLQRNFTLGLPPTSKIFIPVKYLRSNDIFDTRLSLWSQKYFNFWNTIKISFKIKNYILLNILDKSVDDINNKIFTNISMFIINRFQNIINGSNLLNLQKNMILYLLKNKYNYKLFNVADYVNTLSNNKFPLFNVKNKLFINIKQGRSLISNLVFSTKKMAIINSRNLYHYYPFYTKKPYGTGLKQMLFKQSNKFNKTNISMFNKILKLNYMSKYNFSVFSRTQQLSKWISYNVYKQTYGGNKQNLLNVLNQTNTNNLLQSSFGDKNPNKFKYQHLISTYNNWQKFVSKLNLYYYLLHDQYNMQQLTKFTKLNKKAKSFYNYKNTKNQINTHIHKKIKFLHTYFTNKYWIVSGSSPTLQKISNQRNQRNQQNEKKTQEYLATQCEISKMAQIIVTAKAKQKKIRQQVKLQALENKRKLEQARIEQELLRQKENQERELKLQQQQQLEWAEKKERKRLWEEKKLSDQILVHVGLNVRLPSNVWASLTAYQRTQYHIHQKKLRKIEKQKMISSINIINNQIINNNKKN